MQKLLGPKWYAGGLSILTVGATLWPLVRNWREDPEDDFPLSHYPMFSAKRPEKVRVTHLVGLDGRGKRYLIPYKYAGGGGMNQVRRQINRTVREGRADALCQTVAARISLEKESSFAGVVTVQVVTGRYRLADYFSGAREPLSENVRASCPVRRDIS
ncbi:MAG: hypothetical protein ACFB50_05680 [Rubrobacteraceae bacterium]